MERRGEEIARTITEEEGKPLPDARGEVKRAMNIMEYAAGEGRRMFGYTTPSELPNTVAYTVRRPLGVVGIITPWKLPHRDTRLENGSGAHLRQCHRVQTGFLHAVVGGKAGGGVRGGGSTPRCFEPDNGARR